jgi:TonB family protein
MRVEKACTRSFVTLDWDEPLEEIPMRFTTVLLSAALVAIVCAIAQAATVTVPSTQITRIGDISTIPNGVVSPPKVLTFTRPTYTQAALRERVEGTVTLEAAFDSQGHFTILKVLSGLGFGLDDNAIASLKTWQFAAADRNGVPVPVVARIDVEFWLPSTLPNMTLEQRHQELEITMQRLQEIRRKLQEKREQTQ